MQNGFRLGDSHHIDPSLNSVTGPAGINRLEPKVMHVLVCLVEHAGEVVPKERLMQSVWPDTFVGDDVLTRCISELRRAFGDDVKELRFIQTIPKNGYRLIAGVSSRGEQKPRRDKKVSSLLRPSLYGDVRPHMVGAALLAGGVLGGRNIAVEGSSTWCVASSADADATHREPA